MWLIIILVVIAILLLIAELVFLPGISIAGICSFIAFCIAISYAYIRYGVLSGSLVLTITVILAVVAVIVTLKANTWKRLSLDSTIDSTSSTLPQDSNIKVGDVGISMTRLAPMGKAIFGDTVVEAKSPTVFIDQQQEIEVIGFENSVVLVKSRS